MKFDIFKETEDCLTKPITTGCIDDQGEVDTPPDELIIKPSAATVEVGKSVQFAAFLISGVNRAETQIVNGLEFRVTNTSIAVIGVTSGNATGVAEGIVTVSAEWQDLVATAQLEVVQDCALTKVGVIILLDRSNSMAQAFSVAPVPPLIPVYATRYDFARHVAARIASEINEFKDVVGAYTFTDAPTQLSALTDVPTDVEALIQGTGPTLDNQKFTNITDALNASIATLNADTSLDVRVIFLFSDGEHKEGGDPITVAQTFKDSGGYIAVMGLRASTPQEGFQTLSQIATDGMFTNAKPDDPDTAESYMSNLKSYFCGSSCDPEDGTLVYVPELNFTDLINWDSSVATGAVDLIGDGTNGQVAYDFLPGHGLYLDMAGSGGGPWNAVLTSKTTFNFVEANNYRMELLIAGTQRPTETVRTIRVKIGTFFQQDVTITDPAEPFTLYQWDFVGPVGDEMAQIVISQIVGGLAIEDQAFGALIDDVRLQDLDAGPSDMLSDTFNEENPQAFICQSLDCYGNGCIEDAIADQTPDSDPLPDPEAGDQDGYVG